MPDRSLDTLSPARKLALGSAVAGMGMLTALLVQLHSERLRAPAWVALLACACFVFAGLAIALHAWLSRKAYAWIMALLLLVMTLVPAWLALGSGPRHCSSALPWLANETACRGAFGAGALLLLAMVLLAFRMARASLPSARAGSASGI